MADQILYVYGDPYISRGGITHEVHNIRKVKFGDVISIEYDTENSVYTYNISGSVITLTAEQLLNNIKNTFSNNQASCYVNLAYLNNTTKTILINDANNFSTSGDYLVYNLYAPSSSETDDETVNVVGEAAIKVATERFKQFRAARGYSSEDFNIDEFTEFVDYTIMEAAKLQAKYNALDEKLSAIKDNRLEAQSVKAKWIAKNVVVELVE